MPHVAAVLPSPAALQSHLGAAVGPGCADNHCTHANAAEAQLERLIEDDRATPGVPADQFVLFLAFAHDVIDRYGRFLTFLHRDDRPARARHHNELLLAAGVAVPSFIWPNVAPFARDRHVPQPSLPIRGAHLDTARQAVAAARQNELGILGVSKPPRLLALELRYLARTARGPQPQPPGT
ncbi:MAG: hypothetical protein ACRDZS_09820 [Acidimicrobiales bacterium]